MGKKRPPGWPRGTPKQKWIDRSGSSDTSGTSPGDFIGHQTVEGTLERAVNEDIKFEPVPIATRRRPFPIGGDMLAAIVAVLVVLVGGVAYIMNMGTDIALVKSDIKGLQKAHELLGAEIKEQIHRLETGVDRRIGDLTNVFGNTTDLRPRTKATEKPGR